MNYKELLESGETVYHENERFRHFKNAVLSERYFSNYLSYRQLPNLKELQADLAYLAREQADYISDFSFLFFAEKKELPEELRTFLIEAGFSFSKHLIFTSRVSELQLKAHDLRAIRIVQLDASLLEKYLEVEYRQHLQYGKDYANQMLVENRQNVLNNGSKVYLAMDEQEIVGSLTAWIFEGYVEVDDYHVAPAYQGQGIGSHLQLAALKDQEKVILIAEEENREMYQHQGYEEVSWYWTALRSDRCSTTTS